VIQVVNPYSFSARIQLCNHRIVCRLGATAMSTRETHRRGKYHCFFWLFRILATGGPTIAAPAYTSTGEDHGCSSASFFPVLFPNAAPVPLPVAFVIHIARSPTYTRQLSAGGLAGTSETAWSNPARHRFLRCEIGAASFSRIADATAELALAFASAPARQHFVRTASHEKMSLPAIDFFPFHLRRRHKTESMFDDGPCSSPVTGFPAAVSVAAVAKQRSLRYRSQHFAPVAQHDVARLEVACRWPETVSLVEGIRDRAPTSHFDPGGNRTFFSASPASRSPFHHVIVDPSLMPFMERANVRMIMGICFFGFRVRIAAFRTGSLDELRGIILMATVSLQPRIPARYTSPCRRN